MMRGRTQKKGKMDAGTCSTVLSDLLRASEHAQQFPLAPHVSENIPGLLLSTATHTLSEESCSGACDSEKCMKGQENRTSI